MADLSSAMQPIRVAARLIDRIYSNLFIALKEKGLRPKDRAEPGTTCGLRSQFDGLRDGRLPVGDAYRHDAILPHEARDVGRDAVIAVAQNLAGSLAVSSTE